MTALEHRRATARYQERHRKAGLCLSCSRPKVPGYAFCAVHRECAREYARSDRGREAHRRAARAWRMRQASAGRCPKCGRSDDGGGALCRGCRKKNRELNRRKTGSSPWRPGGRGRPPMEWQEGGR